RFRPVDAARAGGVRAGVPGPTAVAAAAGGAEGIGRPRGRAADTGPARPPAHRPGLRPAGAAGPRPTAAVHAVPGRGGALECAGLRHAVAGRRTVRADVL